MLQATLIAISFILGSIPFGVLIAQRRGIDILSVGSGNPGATNVWRTLGAKWGATVFTLDVAKGLLPTIAALTLLSSREWALACGGAAIIGHTFSPFLRFKGGKGVATGLGVLLGISWMVGLSAFGVFIIVLGLFRYVSLSSICAALSLPIFGIVFREPVFLMVTYSLLGVYVIFKHRDNIQRLLKGTERRIGKSAAADSGAKQ